MLSFFIKAYLVLFHNLFRLRGIPPISSNEAAPTLGPLILHGETNMLLQGFIVRWRTTEVFAFWLKQFAYMKMLLLVYEPWSAEAQEGSPSHYPSAPQFLRRYRLPSASSIQPICQ